MKTLLIFDNDVNASKILNTDNQINLFPLTSNFIILEKMENKFKTRTINTTKLINNEVTLLQKSIHNWSCDLGNLHVKNKKLKEWFLLPDKGGSAWWFGLISEKNSVQEDVFFKIAQANAIYKYLINHPYTVCLICLDDTMQANILKKLIKPLVKKTVVLPKKHFKTKKQHFFDFIKRSSILSALLSSLLHWFIWVRDSHKARKKLTPIKKRFKNLNPFLFVTYFPNIDEIAAKNGKFRNKYALALQEKLLTLKIPITWLAMPVYYNGHNYDSSLQLAKKFSEHGENIFILQEFFTITVFCKAVAWWLRQAVLGIYLYYKLDVRSISKKITDPNCSSYFKYIWWHSFIGTSGTRGIIFYLTYREIFRQITNIDSCLYYCEMQAWEKALLMAKKKITPKTRAIAFQHTIVTKNFFHYFHAPEEIKQKNLATDFPVPDQLIANGKLTYALLNESQYPNLRQAEAIRQLYIQKKNHRPLSQPILFVGGSYDKTETKSLLTLLHVISFKLTHFTIWLKGSPINPLEPLFKELDINWQNTGYHISHQDLSELLPYASVALIANTTVALEVLAFDCPLIIPFFADTMLMNPVIDTSAQYTLVSNPGELFTALTETKKENIVGNSDIINHYWNINPAIPQWTEILSN